MLTIHLFNCFKLLIYACLPESWQLAQSVRLETIYVGFGYVFRATPTLDITSFVVKSFFFLEGTPIEVANSNFEPRTLLSILRL
jgi:hypothetical protein